MKHLSKVLLLFSSVLLLAGCGTSKTESSSTPGGSVVSESDYEYSAKDIRYYTKASELIGETKTDKKSRKFYKAFDGYCAVALANIGDGFGPVLVGEDQAQVCYKIDDNATVIQSAGSVEVNDKTYYYSSASFLTGKLDGKTDYGNYFSKFTTLEAVAKDVAEKATFTAVEESSKKYYSYKEENDGTVTLSAGPYFYTLEKATIPNEIDGKTVGAIAARGFAGCNNIKEVVISSNIKTIGKYAFTECAQLHRVFIPTTVTTINEYPFYKDASDLYVFVGAVSKPSGFNSNWGSGVLRVTYGTKGYGENDDYLYGVLLDDTLQISLYKKNEENVVIPPTIDGKEVAVIGGHSFQEKNALKTVTFPDTVAEIRLYAFSKCYLLDNVVLPSGVKIIGKYAFTECSRLSRIYIPSTVTTIDEYPFYKCSDKLFVFVGAASKPAGFNSNWGSGVYLVTYSAKRYGESDTWLYCERLDGNITLTLYKEEAENVTIPATIEDKAVTILGSYLFKDNQTMKTVSFPTSLKAVNAYAFKGCQLITEVCLPYGVESVGKYAFTECPRLVRAYIPASVSTVGEYVFYKDSSEIHVYCGETSKPSGYNSNWANGVKTVTWSAAPF